MSTSLHLLEPGRPLRVYRFGSFEVDPRAGELRKHGTRLRLRQQPLQILCMLVERPGEVVLREDICARLWPDNTVVEFDHSINVAMQKLRDVLGDSADRPRFIETLPKRGYRFVGTVEALPLEVPQIPEVAPVSAPVAPAVEKPAQPTWAQRTRIVSAAMVGLLIIALVWLHPWTSRPPLRNWTLPLGAVGVAAVSPDGTAVVYGKAGGLVLRRLDSLAEVPLGRLGRIMDEPTWSPDGSQLAVQTMDGLMRLPAPRGAAIRICPTMGPTRGLSWSTNGDILFAAFNKGSGLYLVPATGGTPARLEVPGLKSGDFFQPQFLPGADQILFAFVADDDSQASLYLANIRKGKVAGAPRLLRRNLTAGQFSPLAGGMLMYVQDDALYAQKLNVHEGKLDGEPRRIVDAVFSRSSFRKAQFSVSGNGVLAWRAGKIALSRLTWFDRRGKILGTAGPQIDISTLRLSGDDKHILIQPGINPYMGIVEAHQTGYLDLTGIDQALWLSDSSRIVFRRTAALDRIMERPAEGGAEKEVAHLPGNGGLKDVSPDGRVLLYGTGQWKVSAARLDGAAPTRAPEPVILPQETVFAARFSPDGKWIVYCARNGRANEIYIVPFPARGMRKQISSGGGVEPVWRGDGKEILYRSGPKIFSVAVQTKGGEIHANPPEPLFEVRVPDTLVGASEPLAVTRDGSAILFAQSSDPSDPKITYVMTAWDSLLKP